ncbi:MAG: hypothetical protein JW947_06765 [Sedimentisphaerales bacterium]|nr:hypothetical protein [Sedimentisphaerales bacterium]
MKKDYGKILALVITALLSAAALCYGAAEDVNKGEDDIWSEEAAKWEHGQPELTAERIERIINRLAETDPAKAEELKQLKEKDSEKFRAEFREVMREQFGKRMRKRGEQRGEKLNEPIAPGDMPVRRPSEPFGPGHVMPEMGMRWKYDKYLEWLKENYAEEAKKLEGLSKKDPEIYWKHLGFSLKKYGKIAEAARENPRLAEVLKKDLVLRQQQDKLLEEIESADDKEKEELANELKGAISNRFDVIVERKQIEYEQLLERLERLKKDVKERKAKMEKWKDAKFKEDSVKARLEELLGKSDKFTW